MSNAQPHLERTETDRRMQALLDRGEIADLVARSLAAIDEGRFDALRGDLHRGLVGLGAGRPGPRP